MGPHGERHLAAVPGVHEALPAKGTLRCERDGNALLVAMPWDFPILAECGTCGGTIRRQDSLFANWEHVEAQGAKG